MDMCESFFDWIKHWVDVITLDVKLSGDCNSNFMPMTGNVFQFSAVLKRSKVCNYQSYSKFSYLFIIIIIIIIIIICFG